MANLLIIEDEVGLVEFLRLELELQGHQVDVAYTAQEGLIYATTKDYEMIFLDLMLPDGNGVEVCRTVRKETDVPIVILTAKSAVSDRVDGLDAGADDYLVKPFAIEELLARMRALTRRKRQPEMASTQPEGQGETLHFGEAVIDPLRRRVTQSGRPVDLTTREYDLLMHLLSHVGQIFSRHELLKQVWGFESPVDTNVVDVYVGYLRQKLDPNKHYIQTVRGAGFVFHDEWNELTKAVNLL
jgi:DNA-binding response OmpR family regulator